LEIFLKKALNLMEIYGKISNAGRKSPKTKNKREFLL